MAVLRHFAKRTGRLAALSLAALLFILAAAVLLTLAAFFAMAPVYGAAQALLILGLVHLALALLLVGLLLLDTRRTRVRAAPPRPSDGDLVSALVAAFFAGLDQGMAARARRERPEK